VIVWTFLKLTDSILLKQHDKSSPFNSTQSIALYPQNGDRIVNIDSVTSLHPVYTVQLLLTQWRQREFKVGGDEPSEPTVRLPD